MPHIRFWGICREPRCKEQVGFIESHSIPHEPYSVPQVLGFRRCSRQSSRELRQYGYGRPALQPGISWCHIIEPHHKTGGNRTNNCGERSGGSEVFAVVWISNPGDSSTGNREHQSEELPMPMPTLRPKPLEVRSLSLETSLGTQA